MGERDHRPSLLNTATSVVLLAVDGLESDREPQTLARVIAWADMLQPDGVERILSELVVERYLERSVPAGEVHPWYTLTERGRDAVMVIIRRRDPT